MREIKFRGKQNTWIVGGFHKSTDGRCRIFTDHEEFEVDPKSVGEFTGHKCKGQDIFEGDVLQTYCYNEIHKAVVEFTPSNGWTAGGYKLDSAFFIGGGNDFKIIGNIYDNPQ